MKFRPVTVLYTIFLLLYRTACVTGLNRRLIFSPVQIGAIPQYTAGNPTKIPEKFYASLTSMPKTDILNVSGKFL